MARVSVEGEGVELGIVRGVVAVDVGVLENVGLRVEYTKMPNRIAYYVKTLTAENTH